MNAGQQWALGKRIKARRTCPHVAYSCLNRDCIYGCGPRTPKSPTSFFLAPPGLIPQPPMPPERDISKKFLELLR